MSQPIVLVKVSNGEVGVGFRVAWVTRYSGARTGVVNLVAQGARYGTPDTKIRVTPDRKQGEMGYVSPVTLRRLKNVIALAA